MGAAPRGLPGAMGDLGAPCSLGRVGRPPHGGPRRLPCRHRRHERRVRPIARRGHARSSRARRSAGAGGPRCRGPITRRHGRGSQPRLDDLLMGALAGVAADPACSPRRTLEPLIRATLDPVEAYADVPGRDPRNRSAPGRTATIDSVRAKALNWQFLNNSVPAVRGVLILIIQPSRERP